MNLVFSHVILLCIIGNCQYFFSLGLCKTWVLWNLIILCGVIFNSRGSLWAWLSPQHVGDDCIHVHIACICYALIYNNIVDNWTLPFLSFCLLSWVIDTIPSGYLWLDVHKTKLCTLDHILLSGLITCVSQLWQASELSPASIFTTCCDRSMFFSRWRASQFS